MTLPDSAAITAAMALLTDIWNALPLFGTMLALALVFRVGPKVIKVIRGSV